MIAVARTMIASYVGCPIRQLQDPIANVNLESIHTLGNFPPIVSSNFWKLACCFRDGSRRSSFPKILWRAFSKRRPGDDFKLRSPSVPCIRAPIVECTVL